MNRLVFVLLLLIAGAQAVVPARVLARGAHRVMRHRTIVEVRGDWPLHRPLRSVVVRPARAAVGVATAKYLSPIAWTGAALHAAPPRDAVVWEDSEMLAKDDDWTEITLNADSPGSTLDLDLSEGKVQADWVEVVFDNGDAQVVDCSDKTAGPGLYPLLAIKDARTIDHVRVVARARSDEARVTLTLEK